MFNEIKVPNKYEPLSPRNILAFGKLKRRKEIRIIIWAVKKNENSKWLLSKFINSKTELIIIKLIVKRPLKPSIKFAPFIIKRKHKSINIIEKIWFSNHESKKIKSMYLISTRRIVIKTNKNIVINVNLRFGLIFVLISSK